MSALLDGFIEAVPEAIVEQIGRARRVLAVCHENPDADTLGAALAVRHLVRAIGGVADAMSGDPVPPLYDFMPDVATVRSDPDPGAEYDLLVVLDCGSLDRVGAVGERHAALFERLPRVVIDHHASNAARGPSDWVDPGAAATCEMVALLAARLGVPLSSGDGALATALIAGIVMDTATFAHPNATARTLAVSAALVAAGAPLSDVSRRLYRTKPDAQLRLFGRVVGRLESAVGGRVVHATLELADLAATGAAVSHSEGIIDLLAQSETADVAILFKEVTEAETRISVRTRDGGLDATVLTGRFGGGGHARAAGATVRASVAGARAVVLAEAERLLDAGPR